MRSILAWCLLVGAASIAGTLDSAAAISARVLSNAELMLPPDARARDVRWAGPSEVYLSLGKQGVVRMSTTGGPGIQIVPPASRGGFPLSSLLAVGKKHLVVGSPFGGFGWVALEKNAAGKVGQKSLMTVMDIDASDDTATILGADSGDVQGLAKDGAIAWIGTLSSSLVDMRPIMRGRSKPGGMDMARCGFMETGAVRFMLDGSLVIVPGVEPGVYRYGADGKLVQTWDTAPLGIVDDCDIGEEQRTMLGRDFPSRLDWLASRVVVDDLLPLRAGPALILRRVEKGVTKWDLVTLPFRGKPERFALALTFPSSRAHLRGDVRGDKVVLLMYDSPLPGQKSVLSTRLVVLSIAGQ